MNITKLNDIFVNRGAVTALASARAAMMDDWIIDLLRAGKWDPSRKTLPKSAVPATVFCQKDVDHVGDTYLVKVDRNGAFYGYHTEERGESGEILFAKSLGKVNQTEARAAIGKTVTSVFTESRKTNIAGNGPVKGPSPAAPVHGSGQAKKVKKAA